MLAPCLSLLACSSRNDSQGWSCNTATCSLVTKGMLKDHVLNWLLSKQWRRTPKNLGVARGCGAQAGDAPGGPGGYRGRRRRGDAARRDMASAIPRHTRPSATADKHDKMIEKGLPVIGLWGYGTLQDMEHCIFIFGFYYGQTSGVEPTNINMCDTRSHGLLGHSQRGIYIYVS